ncbi:MAG: crotonase/enoyl-CoA hydratase family protein [Candidatus Thiodiazotropha taylori]|uniref:Enoyl-CoA hydratase-related protein n=1 Tax=Candidatus Thiodiazotropha taylori TaxID=2792791 RepID=A0A9E4T5T3_9GAMM|nr:enoyl-CoA hydratase-related protein [Candidatus Thiodiazotropha taylori]MCW4258547.1 crotonase/enoyl-CoA hydratase family protein [Candidatus Thiodiazotropha taylori]
MLAPTQTIEIIEHGYKTLNISYQEDIKAQFFAMDPGEIPCFSHQLLRDIDSFQKRLTNQFSMNKRAHQPVDYLIFTSDVADVFNLGGDLAFFVDCIKNNDRETLTRYARLSIDVLYSNYSNLGIKDVTTISLVNGTALGAGFEAALSSDYIIAVEGSEFKFPEVVFNMFPGMGAYSFLSRRVAPAMVEKMIVNAEGYTAEQLYEMGIVDMIAEKDRLDEALRQFIRRHKKSSITRKAVLNMRNRVMPLEKQELNDIADHWVDSAFSLSDRDINAMSRLVRAQSRMMASQQPSVKESLTA